MRHTAHLYLSVQTAERLAPCCLTTRPLKLQSQRGTPDSVQLRVLSRLPRDTNP
jgi:hypothetical protein